MKRFPASLALIALLSVAAACGSNASTETDAGASVDSTTSSTDTTVDGSSTSVVDSSTTVDGTSTSSTTTPDGSTSSTLETTTTADASTTTALETSTTATTVAPSTVTLPEPEGTQTNPIPGSVVDLGDKGLEYTVSILQVADLTADINEPAVGLLIRLEVTAGEVRPEDVEGQLLANSLIVNEGCGLQRYDVGEGLGGLNQPDTVLAGGMIDGWACFLADPDTDGMLYTPVSGSTNLWMELPE